MRAKTLIWIGLALMLLALVFNTLETWYFGWNMFPKSAQEMACDNFSIVLLGVGIAFFAKGIFGLRVVPDRSNRRSDETTDFYD
ncbi:hypothetical protein [Alicyclobacillus macrosporangiidus]|uniref:Uncharacterized protein n=1 Tax=Alicyclobacillus macrosporangiidus TaxID=392015 RepID=A0A1I7KEK4_9BACL|nr:hypothetical protein [Alicyclobacillus macrosporangiidus]SFU95835.1 hypothetical protein SAMN05421543_11576 [Alicyclobacillus macrosporangiidus]